jgi:hypothetical protein
MTIHVRAGVKGSGSQEAGVLRVTFVISVVITAVCAVLALIWAY